MDYEREDRLSLKRAYAGLESERRHDAGEYPFTLLEAAYALGLDAPVSHDDLITLSNVCETWNVRTNIDRDVPGSFVQRDGVAVSTQGQ